MYGSGARVSKRLVHGYARIDRRRTRRRLSARRRRRRRRQDQHTQIFVRKFCSAVVFIRSSIMCWQ
jgi:hypothetical protein